MTRLGACLAIGALVGGCHVVFGLDDVEVDEGASVAPFTIDDACEVLCAADQAHLCGGYVCSEPICRSALLYDPFPWCVETMLGYGECLSQQPVADFACNEGFPALQTNACNQEYGTFRGCLIGDFPDPADDCDLACKGPLNGVCEIDAPTCLAGCLEHASATDPCGGFWAGMAHCTAMHPEAPWSCTLLYGNHYATPASEGHPCGTVFGLLAECLFGGD